jgi:hypothetical protein
MKQQVTAGDRLVVRGHRVGDAERDAQVLEVLGEDGPYRVLWSDDGHESILYPGSDVYIEHFPTAGQTK